MGLIFSDFGCWFLVWLTMAMDWLGRQNILTAILKGFFDSIKGITVIFYLDKEMNKRIEEKQLRRSVSVERSFNPEAKATTRFGNPNSKDNKRDE